MFRGLKYLNSVLLAAGASIAHAALDIPMKADLVPSGISSERCYTRITSGKNLIALEVKGSFLATSGDLVTLPTVNALRHYELGTMKVDVRVKPVRIESSELGIGLVMREKGEMAVRENNRLNTLPIDVQTFCLDCVQSKAVKKANKFVNPCSLESAGKESLMLPDSF